MISASDAVLQDFDAAAFGNFHHEQVSHGLDTPPAALHGQFTPVIATKT